MGSSMMQPQQQDPQQMLMQSMPPQQPPQMPTAYPPGGGMMMPGPQQPRMGGGKGDVNPLMMLFPGIGRHARERQMQDWQMGMEERKEQRAAAVDAYNMRQHQAGAAEEAGGREAIGRTIEYGAEHPEMMSGGLQGMLKGIKAANPNVDPKLLGPVLQAWAPLAKTEEADAIKSAALVEKTQSDQAKIQLQGENTDIKRQNLGLTEERIQAGREKDAALNKYRDSRLKQFDQGLEMKNQQVQQKNVEIANAKQKNDTAAMQRAEHERDQIIESAKSEPAAAAALANIDDEETKAKAMEHLKAWGDLQDRAKQNFSSGPTSPPAQAPIQGQQSGSSAPAAPVSNEPMKVMNDEDYAKVPAGGSYIDPNGNVRKKGGGVGQ